MSDHERIWLQPPCCAEGSDEGRLWCQDPDPTPCDDDVAWTEYVRADLLATKDAEIIARLREALKPFADAHFYYSDAGKSDDLPTGVGGVTYGDFRRAVSVLAELGARPPAPDPAEAMRAVEVDVGEPLGEWISEEEGTERLHAYADGCAVGAEAMRAKCGELMREAMEALAPFFDAKTELTDREAIRARDVLTKLKYAEHEGVFAALKGKGERK